MGLTAAPMTAHTGPEQQRLLADQNLLGELAYAVGGPFHVMFPDRIAANLRAFQQAFDGARVAGRIYFGKKANKARCAIQACAENGAGADVASTGELVSALAGGVRGPDIMVTGPEKSDALLWLAIRHGAVIALDSLSEADRVTALASQDSVGTARVLLRANRNSSDSRLGFSPADLRTALERISPHGPVELHGFSFHLPGYDIVDRAEFALELVSYCHAARAAGHPATMLSIGGGFTVDYVSATDWDRFTNNCMPQWFHQGRQFDSYYPYHNDPAGSAMLAAILGHKELAGRVRAAGVTLAIEPGRALLDQAGCTVFRVQGVKAVADYQFLTVDGTSLSLSEQWFGSEYLPDPLLWPARPDGAAPQPGCVGGASCLEQDVLSWRRIPFSRPAAVGDLLVYPNTAGYQMDSNESTFHELPLPPKVVVREREQTLRWRFDDRGLADLAPSTH